ncbi:MAG: Hsp20/alpha crystallin family protein [Streptosporangiaceae bacterium]
MSTLTRKDIRGQFPDLLDWLESPLAALRPFAPQPIRIEDYVTGSHYVVRAELPGLDPGRQIDVTVAGGVLTITADREDDTEGRHHSEFRYGVFCRQVTLPDGADAEHVRASYDQGILEIVTDITEPAATDAQHRIPVRVIEDSSPA